MAAEYARKVVAVYVVKFQGVTSNSSRVLVTIPTGHFSPPGQVFRLVSAYLFLFGFRDFRCRVARNEGQPGLILSRLMKTSGIPS